MSGILLDLRDSLVTTFVFPRKNLIVYFVLLGPLLFISTRSTLSLWTSCVYLRESLIWIVVVGFLACVYFIQTLFGVLTRGVSSSCDTASLITSFSNYGVKSIGLPVLGSYFLHMDEKAKLNLESIDINPTILKNTENLLKPAWMYDFGRNVSE